MKTILYTLLLFLVIGWSAIGQSLLTGYQSVVGRKNSAPAGSNPIELIDVGTATYVSSGDITPDLPANAEGDLLVMVWTTRLTTGPSVPSGWTQLFSSAQSSTIRTVVLYKIAGASESAPTVTSATSDVVAAQIASFRYVDATTPLTAGTVAGGSITSPATYTAPAVSPVDDDGAVIVLASMNNDASGGQTLLAGDSLTWEAIGDASTTIGSDISFSWQLGVGSGAITMTDKTIQRSHTAVVGQAVQIAVTPE